MEDEHGWRIWNIFCGRVAIPNKKSSGSDSGHHLTKVFSLNGWNDDFLSPSNFLNMLESLEDSLDEPTFVERNSPSAWSQTFTKFNESRSK